MRNHALSVADSVAALDVSDPPVSESVNPDLKVKAETAPKEKDETVQKDNDGNRRGVALGCGQRWPRLKQGEEVKRVRGKGTQITQMDTDFFNVNDRIMDR